MTILVSSFGAVGNGTTDDTTSIQNAINAAQAAKDVLLFEPNKVYRTTRPLIVQQGGPSKREFFMDGAHSEFKPDHAGYLIEVQPLMPIASIGTGQDTGSISMKRFDVRSATAGASGILVGRAGYRMYDEARVNLLEDVTFYELKGQALCIRNSGHFDLARVTARTHVAGGKGLWLEGRDGVFAGDITFNDCQFGSLGGDGDTLTIAGLTNTGSRSEVRGVRFQNCVFYNTGSRIVVQNNALVADLWFESCAWDAGPAGSALKVLVENGGKLNKMFVDNPYIVNYARGFELIRQGTGEVDSFEIRGGAIGFVGEPVWAEAFENFSIKDMHFDGNTGWSCINLHTGCRRFLVQGNQGSNRNSMTNLIAVGLNGADRGLVTDNVAFGFNVVQAVGGTNIHYADNHSL